MSKPDWCPQDVWEAADAAWCEAYSMRKVGPANTLSPIARAILAERERCAKVCDRERDNAKGNGVPQAAIGAAWCAKAIRAGTTE